ncbi:MAG: pentapeptide repeat-containing protein [Deltaproteobacteria bacterium]|nr:pentapeptide repeat-containing protein [Deltaproteobacteria bacterium]
MAGANVSGSTFDGAVMAGADFSAGADELEADLSAARLVSVDFSAANLSGANLSKADLSSANLKNARFNGANLSGARLRSTLNSESADFSGAVYDELTEFPADWSCARLAERGLKYQASGNADAVRTCDQIVDDDSEALRVAIARRTAAINQLRNPAARN